VDSLAYHLCSGTIYIPNGKNTGYVYNSCAAFIINGSGVDFTYCGNDAASVTCTCAQVLFAVSISDVSLCSIHGGYLQRRPRLEPRQLLLPRHR
jgi:hypothetical protein